MGNNATGNGLEFDFASTFAKIRTKIPLKSIFSALLVLVVTIMSFGTVSTNGGTWLELGGMAILLYITSIMLYSSNYSTGEMRAKDQSEWKAVTLSHKEIARAVRLGNRTAALDVWCEQKRQVIRESYIKTILKGTPVDYESFTKDFHGRSRREIMRIAEYNGKRLDHRARLRIATAASCGDPRLSAAILLYESSDGENPLEPIGLSPETRHKRDVRLAMVARLFTTFVAGYLTVDFVGDMSWASFGLWLMRMFPLITAAAAGSLGGWENIARHGVSFRAKQIAYLEEFEAAFEGGGNNVQAFPIEEVAHTGDRSDQVGGELHPNAGEDILATASG